MKYLGIDYGKRKIGLSISSGIFAAPFNVLRIQKLPEGLHKIVEIIQKEEIDIVVIGLPESGESKKNVRIFLNEFDKLKETKEYLKKIQIILVDETLSTQDARNFVHLMGVRKDKEDAYAASLILQNYLDSKPA